MVTLLLPKQTTRVRFPSPAPEQKGFADAGPFFITQRCRWVILLKRCAASGAGLLRPSSGALGLRTGLGALSASYLDREVPRSRAKNDKLVTKRREKLQIGYKMVTN